MKGFVILILAGLAVYFFMVTMGSAYSFGAAGGEINMFTNKAESIYGEAVSIQGNGNSVASDKAVSISGNRNHVSQRSTMPQQQQDNEILVPFIVAAAIIGFMIWAIFGRDEWEDDNREPSTVQGRPLTTEEWEAKERKYGPV